MTFRSISLGLLCLLSASIQANDTQAQESAPVPENNPSPLQNLIDQQNPQDFEAMKYYQEKHPKTHAKFSKDPQMQEQFSQYYQQYAQIKTLDEKSAEAFISDMINARTLNLELETLSQNYQALKANKKEEEAKALKSKLAPLVEQLIDLEFSDAQRRIHLLSVELKKRQETRATYAKEIEGYILKAKPTGHSACGSGCKH